MPWLIYKLIFKSTSLKAPGIVLLQIFIFWRIFAGGCRVNADMISPDSESARKLFCRVLSQRATYFGVDKVNAESYYVVMHSISASTQPEKEIVSALTQCTPKGFPRWLGQRAIKFNIKIRVQQGTCRFQMHVYIYVSVSTAYCRQVSFFC